VGDVHRHVDPGTGEHPGRDVAQQLGGLLAQAPVTGRAEH
jgi:hypothetical protein